MNCLSTHKGHIFFLILLLQLTTEVYGQDISFVRLTKDPEFTLETGKRQYVSLSFLIKEDYHIQADQVKDENLIPTGLSLEGPYELIFGDPVFPESHEFRMKGSEETWQVFNDVLEIRIPVTVPEAIERGEFPVKGKLYYQACNKFKCYFPRELSFNMEIKVK